MKHSRRWSIRAHCHCALLLAVCLLVLTTSTAMATPVGYEFTGAALRAGLEAALASDPDIMDGLCDVANPLSTCGIYAVAVTPVNEDFKILSGISPVASGASAWGVALDHFDIYELWQRVFVEYHDLHTVAMAPLSPGDEGFPACAGCTEVALLTTNALIAGNPLEFETVTETMAALSPGARFHFVADVTGQPLILPVWVEVIFTQLDPVTGGASGVKTAYSLPFQMEARSPEPTTIGLCALGLAAAVFLRRKSKQSMVA